MATPPLQFRRDVLLPFFNQYLLDGSTRTSGTSTAMSSRGTGAPTTPSMRRGDRMLAKYPVLLLILGGVAPVEQGQLHSMTNAGLQSYRTAQASSVLLPYTCIALLLITLATALAVISLRRHSEAAAPTQDFRAGTFALSKKPLSIWRRP
jgi:hypothetical protein